MLRTTSFWVFALITCILSAVYVVTVHADIVITGIFTAALIIIWGAGLIEGAEHVEREAAKDLARLNSDDIGREARDNLALALCRVLAGHDNRLSIEEACSYHTAIADQVMGELTAGKI